MGRLQRAGVARSLLVALRKMKKSQAKKSLEIKLRFRGLSEGTVGGLPLKLSLTAKPF
jgi:hypothetical protein